MCNLWNGGQMLELQSLSLFSIENSKGLFINKLLSLLEKLL